MKDMKIGRYQSRKRFDIKEVKYWLALNMYQYISRWFWIHSLKVADYTSWQSTQPNGDFRSNFALIHHSLEGFKWFDYSNEQSPAFAICQLDMEY